MTKRSFSTRLGILHQDVISPFQKGHVPGVIMGAIIRKMERSYGLSKFTINNEFKRGLVFTAAKSGYFAGRDRCNSLLEWRSKNTYLFKIKVLKDAEMKLRYQLMICDKVVYKVYDNLTLESGRASE
jgi:hypothetical protein